MGRASRIASTARGVLTLETGRWPEFTPGHGPRLELGAMSRELSGYECVYDLAVAGDRVAALVEDLGERTLVTTTLALDKLHDEAVGRDISRVALTREQVFVIDPHHLRLGGTSVLPAPIDVASSPMAVAVVQADHVRFVDVGGIPRERVDVFAPTAIAVDAIDGGWLVAADGGVYHLERGNLRRLASVAEPVRKVRRDREAVYVLVGNELRAIRGDRVEVLGTVDDNAWYWTDFDADASGLVTYGKL